MLLLRFLIGDAQAIRTVAGGRWSWAVGLLMLLSAGFARDYDREDLLAEPWHLLLPLAASTALVLVLWFCVRYAKHWDGDRPGGCHLLGLLTAVWWMAPMAWLYAIPWERMLEPDAALKNQILTLQIVSVWRVILAGRIVHVLFGGYWMRSYVLVAALACAAMFFALMHLGPEILILMGGFTPEPWELRISNAKILGMIACLFFGVVSFVIGFIAWLVPSHRRVVPVLDSRRLPWVAPSLLTLFVCVGIGMMAVETQRQQRLATAVDQAWREHRVTDAVTLLVGLERHQIPTYWQPVQRGFDAQPWREAVTCAIQQDAKPWLRTALLDRIWEADLVRDSTDHTVTWHKPTDQQLVLTLAAGLPRNGKSYWQYILRIMEQPAPAPSP